MIKGKIQQEDRTFVNIYGPNIEAPKYIFKILTNIKGEIDSNTIITGDFNTQITSMDRSFRQKINKETLALKETLHQMDLISIYKTLNLKAEYTLVSNAHEMFSKIDPMLGYKTSLNKFKKIEIISSFFSNHTG